MPDATVNGTTKAAPLLISAVEFEKTYGELFREEFSQAKQFTDNPHLLKAEVEKKASERSFTEIDIPRPDEFQYRLKNYRGYVRYPDRLRNAIVAMNDGPGMQVRHFPMIVDVEPTSRCNFRCVMCQLSEMENGVRHGDMDFDKFKEFIERYPYFIEVKLQGLGEPFMNRHFTDMVGFLNERDIWVRSTVNGSLLGVRENYKQLIDAGIGEVQISFDGADRETFESIRINSKFDTIVSNLTKLNQYAEHQGRNCTRMWVLVQRNNRHQIKKFVDLARQMGFKRLTFSVNIGDWGRDEWAENNEKLRADDFNEEELDYFRAVNNQGDLQISIWQVSSKYTAQNQCPMPQNRTFIGSDFRMAPCGGIGNPDTADLGNAMDFSQSWNGKKYGGFRRLHLEGRPPKYCEHCYVH